ncbi:MAG: FkbM family methyltransferase, partial [Nitrososphaeria archaeon]
IFYKNNKEKFNGGIQNGNVEEIFFENVYEFLIPRSPLDFYVLDIGANIGDSAIYFAPNSAKRVFGIEPCKNSFERAIENISQNNLSEKIEIINALYGQDGSIYVSDEEGFPGSSLVKNDSGKMLNVFSLKSLIDKFHLNLYKNVFLKVDCEGCEYYLLNEDDDVIKTFTKISIEYHYGQEKLVNKLKECGFTVEYTKPEKSYNSDARSHMLKGMIYAEQGK